MPKKKPLANPTTKTGLSAQPWNKPTPATPTGAKPPAPTLQKSREDILAEAVQKAHALGFDEGYQKAKRDYINELAYNQGVRNIIAIAENHLAKELGLKSRQDLATCDKIPSWWIATLFSDIWYKPSETEKVGGEKRP